ncbi:GntR family transcriptional regulator [Flagellimonas halotolerans]|uniref:GntR family transcriptional regulator n=1 Tax=Flagellimonas halotolerans TaxID=3112164 RepID=A0ABU6IUI9_9FLAO|nr:MULTISPECIES: GntR family transcriptional regulator [unclassified Allomuricauda]MEC3966934.1 GntR family transcriptional regulator [Muricauda sp. SYSU M86414]MEC4266797.1 GntR family transcriptional regulator [Muricauda sp. SYSU M84420]
MALLDRILEFRDSHLLSKHEMLVQGVIEAIREGEFQVGDKLPSINIMVRDVGYARKTIVRAYEELKDRGLVESKKKQGYFVISQETGVLLRVALLLFAFQSFQQDFYNNLRNELGNKFQVDVFFHHNNLSIFETMISNIKGKYGMYMVAPIQDDAVIPMLRSIPPNKLILVDRYLDLGPEYSFIAQEFENSTYNKMFELLPEIQKYEQVVLFLDNKTDYSPPGIRNAFERFVKDHGIKGSIEESYVPETLKKNTLYFIKNDSILWKFLKECSQGQCTLGKDLGILSYDDNVLKEIIMGGITTISTNCKAMGKMAANFVVHQNKIRTIVPTELIRRNSL